MQNTVNSSKTRCVQCYSIDHMPSISSTLLIAHSLLPAMLTHGVFCHHSNNLSIVTTLSILQDIVHTVYRMSYMNIAALAKRIRDVSRGSGKQSHHKMLLFYYALKAAELPELAQNALKVLQSLDIDGLPDKNE